MNKVFLIPGLGADKRLYKNIRLPEGYEPVLLDWILPSAEDTLIDYAQKLIDQYDMVNGAIVIGDSLGGVLAVEIAKKIDLRTVILISSIKTDSEAPWYFKLFRNVPVYKIIPGNLMTKVGFMVRPVFGKMEAEDLAIFKSMIRESSPVFMKWAMQAILNWRNNLIPPNLYHIIGDKDLVFPPQYIINPTAIIKGGTHIMVFDRADEINKLLAEILLKP